MNKKVYFLLLVCMLIIIVLASLYKKKEVQSTVNRSNTSSQLFVSESADMTIDDRTFQEIENIAFHGDLPDTIEQEYPPVSSLTDLQNRIDGMFIRNEVFFSAYPSITVISNETDKERFHLSYELQEKDYDAYAYYSSYTKSNPKVATLIIPGSGSNQSSKIFFREPDNYHGDIVSVTEKFGDTFILVRPNGSFVAIHNGKYKLDDTFYTAYLLNKGGSYSAKYIVDSMALTKYLKSNYEKVYVLGLSQGGGAALLNALQSEPFAAIISSGYSVFEDSFYYAGFDQIIIPYLHDHFTSQKIKNTIVNSSAQYVFSYGLQDADIYGLDAKENKTCGFFQNIDNVTCIIHQGGHVFPLEDIQSFYRKSL